MTDPTPQSTAPVEQVESRAEAILARLFAAAQPGSVFAEPLEAGGYTVITASEVMSAGGFGSGQGSGRGARLEAAPNAAGEGAGAGGGGYSSGRPVAAIVIGPEGVTIRPILDTTKLLIAGISAWASVAVFLGRLVKRR